jgi:hypothetical protein
MASDLDLVARKGSIRSVRRHRYLRTLKRPAFEVVAQTPLRRGLSSGEARTIR